MQVLVMDLLTKADSNGRKKRAVQRQGLTAEVYTVPAQFCSHALCLGPVLIYTVQFEDKDPTACLLPV